MAAKISQYSKLSDCAPIERHLILFLGQSESGKSTLCKSAVVDGLLRPDPLWVKVIILSPTAKMQDTWAGFSDIYTDPNKYANIVQQVIDEQEERVKLKVAHPVLIIIDDIIGGIERDESAKLGRLIIKLASTGRHYKICLWMLTQNFKNSLISNVDVRNNMRVLVSTVVSSTSKDELVKIIGSKDAVEHAFKEAYRFIVFDNTADSVRAGNRISFVKINPREVKPIALKYV